MKDVLIVIHGLGCGGAEKSLIAFLEFLPRDKWNIDLVVANPHGIFMDKIPSYVHVIDNLYNLENFSTPLENRNKKVCGVRDFICQVNWKLRYPFLKKRGRLSYGEAKWKLWGKYLPVLEKKYNLAVSYMNGFTNYYVMEKVKADKKILWVHNEFEKLGYDYNFEAPFYRKADAIVTISESCKDSILRIYPDIKEKVSVLENISSSKAIRKMAEKIPKDDYFQYSKMRILSVGRLMEQKAFDLAIKAAAILKNRKVEFIWYIIGEGELRPQLENLIRDKGLHSYVKLVGLKSNPYPYIAECDIFVQSSRYEGKSIVLDEAKILCRPIVVTNYKTVSSSITDGVNGIICDMNDKDLADKIQNLIERADIRESLMNQLLSEKNGNEGEIYKYLKLFETMLGNADNENAYCN